MVKAIQDQAAKYLHTCLNVMMYEPAVEIAEKLNSITPGNFEKRTVFFNSSAEADENAVKIARYATGRSGIICFDHAFHGRTLLSMTLTSKVKPYKVGFGPITQEIYRADYPYPYRDGAPSESAARWSNYLDYFYNFFKNHVDAAQVAAMIVEPVAGEGGFVIPPPEFLPTLRDICSNNGIQLIADEV